MKRWNFRLTVALLAVVCLPVQAQQEGVIDDGVFYSIKSDTVKMIMGCENGIPRPGELLRGDSLDSSAGMMVIQDTVYIRDTVFVFMRPGSYKRADSVYMALAGDKRSERILRKRMIGWNKLIPDYSKIQFAGGMGMFSFGAGWDYGKKRQWETDLFFGFVPHFHQNRATMTVTLKQNYIPWSLHVAGEFYFEPLETGIYINYLTSKKFWGSEPKKYGGAYYRYTQDLRTHVFIGQRIKWDLSRYRLPAFKAVSFFYEASSNDLYLISKVPNGSLGLWDIIVFSLGLKFHIM